MKKFCISIAVCITLIASQLLTAQEHPFHLPPRGKRAVKNNVATNISSINLLPDKLMSKSNGAIPLKGTLAVSGL